MADIQQRFACDVCGYSTNKRSSYDKHLYTWKHLRNREVYMELIRKSLVCVGCGKEFKRRMWYNKHIAKCVCDIACGDETSSVTDDAETPSCGDTPDAEARSQEQQSVSTVDGRDDDANDDALAGLPKGGMTNELIMTMMQYVRDNERKRGEHMEMMQKQLEEERNQCKMLMNTVQDMIPKIGNFNNNKISINIFLQEHCKDALNLKDFVESLRIELSDVSKFQDRSMIDAVGNVFVNGLRQLDLYKRPIHCMDLSRETLYIKDNDAWENATRDNPKLSGAISAVAAKQSKVLQEWEKLHPEWHKNESLTAEYLRLVRATTCPIERGSACEGRIIHSIAKEVVVDLKNVKQ